MGDSILQPEGPSRYSDLSENYHAWGLAGLYGTYEVFKSGNRNAANKASSPGRFYAAVATKLILAYVLKSFDCSFVDKNMEKPASGGRMRFQGRTCM